VSAKTHPLSSPFDGNSSSGRTPYFRSRLLAPRNQKPRFIFHIGPAILALKAALLIITSLFIQRASDALHPWLAFTSSPRAAAISPIAPAPPIFLPAAQSQNQDRPLLFIGPVNLTRKAAPLLSISRWPIFILYLTALWFANWTAGSHCFAAVLQKLPRVGFRSPVDFAAAPDPQPRLLWSRRRHIA
jgi:hypothetical protein